MVEHLVQVFGVWSKPKHVIFSSKIHNYTIERSGGARSRGRDSWSCCGRTLLTWRLWSNICDSLINWSSVSNCESETFLWKSWSLLIAGLLFLIKCTSTFILSYCSCPWAASTAWNIAKVLKTAQLVFSVSLTTFSAVMFFFASRNSGKLYCDHVEEFWSLIG